MNEETILGICRFSFLGAGDWMAFRQNKDTSPERMDKIARDLYDDARMEQRFEAFQKICLASVLAQTDPNFDFIILTSNRMPEHWRKRLIEICEPHDQIMIIWSDILDTNKALTRTLKDLHALSGGQLWQFRLDDDDAIDVNYIARLRNHIARMRTLDRCGISIVRGIYVTLYEGRETQFLEYRTPFQSAGACVKLANPGSSIFVYGHFGIRTKLTNFVDCEALGALMLKWHSDSRPMNLDQLPSGVRRLTQEEYTTMLRDSFPFLENVDFDALRRPISSR